MNKSKVKSFLSFTFVLLISIYSLFASGGQIEQLQNYYQNCEYQKAIKLAELILKNPNLAKKERTETYIIKGVAEFSSNQILNAESTFTELLLFDGNITLDSKRISPKIVEFFNELKNKLKPA